MAWSMRREQTSGDSRYGCCECLLSCSSSCSGRSDLCAHCSCWYSQLRSSGRTLQCASFAAPLGCMAASASHACAAAPAISAAAASSAAAVDAAARTPIAPKVSVDVGDGDESDDGEAGGCAHPSIPSGPCAPHPEHFPPPHSPSRWEARGSMLRWTFAVWVPFSPSPSTLS